ncbi:hypothetical protein OAF54_00270 [bacterium]|nr:hypothetical protein [bacterium]
MVYTCGRCLAVMAEAWEAVALRVEEEELGMARICDDCVAIEAKEHADDE